MEQVSVKPKKERKLKLVNIVKRPFLEIKLKEAKEAYAKLNLPPYITSEILEERVKSDAVKMEAEGKDI